jgi:hypothetical protein
MAIGRAILTVAACSVLFSLLGGAAGYLLGTLIPGYYRGVFRAGDLRGFDPVQVGTGLGVSQGLMGGAVVGLILVALVAWHDAQSGRSRR